MNRKISFYPFLCFLLIAIASICFRLFDFFNIPFSNDELSAIFRTRFDNISDLIKNGVYKDIHPPLVLYFLYFWTKIFGEAEWVVKLPFILSGFGSIIFVYLLGKKWFNSTVGLIVAAFFSSMEFVIMYTQTARSYVSGLFFSLALCYYWVAIIDNEEKIKIKNVILYILFSTLCCYNHHFSFIFAAMTGISGLFFLKGKKLIHYLLLNLIIVILYLPNLPLLFMQLKVGGVEEWLGKPDNFWFINYIKYIFHFSIWVGIVVVFLSFLGWRHPKKENTKWIILSGIWFILPFLIGFFYSKYVNAILQYSTMFFTLPFLMFFLFGQIKKQSGKINLIIVSVILFVNSTSLIFNRQYFKLFYSSPLEKIVVDFHSYNSKYHNTVSLLSWNPYLSYYFDKYKIESNVIFLENMSNCNLIKLIDSVSKTTDFIYLGALSLTAPETYQIIQSKYPSICEKNNYFGASTFVFSKKGKSIVSSNIIFKDDNYHELDSTMLYSEAITLTLKNIIKNKNDFVDISLDFISNKVDSGLLVAEICSNNKTTYWTASIFNNYVNKDTSTLYLTLKLSDIKINYKNAEVKVYIWNRKLENIKYKNVTIKQSPNNPVLYGLFENVEK